MGKIKAKDNEVEHRHRSLAHTILTLRYGTDDDWRKDEMHIRVCEQAAQLIANFEAELTKIPRKLPAARPTEGDSSKLEQR